MTFSATFRAAASITLAFACIAGQAQSGNPAPMTPLAHPDPRIAGISAAMRKVKSPSWAAISPDGATVAWTARAAEGTQIHLTSVANPDPAKEKIVTPSGATACANAEPIWSPDGVWLAYTSTCTSKEEKPGQEQIFLWNKASGESKQLTHLSGLFQDVAWSPDGKSLAFLFVENASRNAGALAAMKPWSGVVGEDGVEIQRIATVSVADGKLTQVTPATLHCYEFGWSPDSKSIVYTAAAPPGENTWWIAQLYTQPAVAGAQPKSVFDPNTTPGPMHGLQLAVPRFSPDGKSIAFIGGLMSDQGSTGGDIYLIPASGHAEPKNLTPNRPATPVWFAWEDVHTLGINEDVRGKNHLFLYNIDTKAEDPAFSQTFDQSVRSGGIKGAISGAKNGPNLALIESGFNQAPEVFAGPLNGLKQLTHLNDGLKPTWGKSESIEWENEGFHVQGWLMYPVNYDAKKKYPMIVSVHGGPSASIGSTWAGGGALYSALGYFVFSPNPRGSYGQGERFTQANIKDFGYGDLRDILAGMDVIEKKVSVDKNREGLTGWSYGGFMTMFAVTQTNRFKAAVAGAGIANWQSYYGENSIDQWMLPFFGKTVYDDPAVYAKSSAISYIHNAKTPTLVLVGDRDGECPAPQSFEFWHALRAEGVKTQLVIYPNEGHGFVDPAHVQDRNERIVDWFEREMPKSRE
ncbi:Dipeptidyl aminopeptidase/acylaminoacyl peptidase [Granulicella rosea]|uniref:Dipeptidyl aminopeptidase/acylaminoacyl peptidase n=1 Tax=Granulicella rosea TaxID=474952 RepID=A0A239L2H0_9BACT|nr:S9 family peptidase [Granulicella rosea]SNT23744.1 Dipeptidyl aminopeptidase/acylaminoacyl peptidase [Granulicella rosea]